ncbi:glutathione S-transferase family protein [Echinimonas agarilytica]|uniref:Glutathione S-transferase family protein n=1 Tax=Echinimonas agarilytica TaxID=1215918 RepID=A0AA42B8D2_9GAMM|nr:glutathione S-transferase family protein [Echinimonas agarilytica]MCM2680066.1 glutathione S-transferase family protein [Echinimonas agarilytica]
MITLYGSPRSRSLRVSWCLEELGLEWVYKRVDLSKGEHRSEGYLAMNPNGKVPMLTDDDLVLSESFAICMYLAETYGNGKLLPTSVADKGRHHQWLSLITCELEQPLWTMGKHKFALPEPQRVEPMLEVAEWEFEKICNELEPRMPDTDSLFDEFTVADILLTQTLNWAVKFGQPLPPKLAAYRKRNSQRPALSLALDKELA